MEVGVVVEDFLQTGRTGRRNAMADITDPRIAGVSTAGVDFTFDKMSMSGVYDCLKLKSFIVHNSNRVKSKNYIKMFLHFTCNLEFFKWPNNH